MNEGKGFANMLGYMGVVEDNRDPLQMGRVRVRCFGIHSEHKAELKTEDLPWAVPVIGTYAQDYRPPNQGSWVFGVFLDGEDAQFPIVFGVFSTMPTGFGNPEYGFSDPQREYPTPCSTYQPEISRLARAENIEETYVAERLILQETDIESADGTTWKEPDPAYNAQYPHNKAYETNSGHVIEYDDTPGAERINFQHRSGSYMEMQPNGNMVTKIMGDGYTIYDNNGRIYIKGKADIKVDGACNIYVENDCNLTVDGNLNQKVHGNYNLDIGGEFKVNVQDSIRFRGSSIRADAYLESFHVTANRFMRLKSGEDMILRSTGSVGIRASDGIYQKASKQFSIQSSEEMYIHGAGPVLHIKSSGNINIDAAPDLYLNSDKAEPGVNIEYVEPILTGLSQPIDKKVVIRSPEKIIGENVPFTERIYGKFDVNEPNDFSDMLPESDAGVEQGGNFELTEGNLFGKVNGFTEEETLAYISAIGRRESSNNYRAVNQFNYLGKYQLGALGLTDIGYVKPGTSNSGLDNPANWTGKNGIYSKEDFLNNREVQEKAMLQYTNRNLSYLKGNGGIKPGDSKTQIAGMLAGAHLLGAGGMNQWRRGFGGADANGTTGDEYYALGSAAINSVNS